MTKPIIEREKILDDTLKRLHKENAELREGLKILEKRLEFIQDAEARNAVEMETITKSIKFIMDIGNKLIDKHVPKSSKKETMGGMG